MQRAAKKLFVKTYGCQMNDYDSDRIYEVMGEIGFARTDEHGAGGCHHVLNTCHIREKAAEKVYSELGRVKQVRNKRLQEGNDTTIVVAGCVAQAEGREILARAPLVNIVIGPQKLSIACPTIFFPPSSTSSALSIPIFPADFKFEHMPERERAKN